MGIGYITITPRPSNSLRAVVILESHCERVLYYELKLKETIMVKIIYHRQFTSKSGNELYSLRPDVSSTIADLKSTIGEVMKLSDGTEVRVFAISTYQNSVDLLASPVESK